MWWALQAYSWVHRRPVAGKARHRQECSGTHQYHVYASDLEWKTRFRGFCSNSGPCSSQQ